MPDAFDQLNDAPQHPAAVSTTATVTASAQQPQAPAPTQQTSQGGDAFDQLETQQKAQQPTQQSNTQTAATKEQVAQHGILRRAWDFVNSPIADLSVAGHRLLPEGVKTSDIIKAAAFEKMYGEAYIPGYNDFDTKAEEHLGPAPAKVTTKDGHPYVATPESHAFKNALRTFIAGVGKDTSDMAAGFTSPVGIATTALGVGPEGKAVNALRPLVGTAFALKGAHDIYHAGTANTPEAWQERLQGASMVAGGAAASSEAASNLAGKVSDTTGRGASAAKNFVTGGQSKLQPAIRGAAQTAADLGAARPSIELATGDQHPVSVEFDEDNNVVNSDGRHRVVQAWKDGVEKIPVEVKTPTGVETKEYSPAAFAGRVGLGNTLEEAQENLASTDEQQPYRAGNLQPREAQTKVVGKQVPGEPAVQVEPKASLRSVLQDVSEDIEGRGKKIYQALDKATDNKFTTYTERLNKINDRLSDLIPDTTEADDSAIERLEQSKSELETSQEQMFENLKDSGIDPKIVDDAKAHWRQAMALRDVDAALKTSMKGNAEFGVKEAVDPNKLVTRLEKLNVSRNGQPSRLAQALGEDGADALMKDAYSAVKTKQALKYTKWATGIAAGLGLVRGDLHNLLSWAGAIVP
jgi:uncharacterized protein (UPF0335 family)